MTVPLIRHTTVSKHLSTTNNIFKATYFSFSEGITKFHSFAFSFFCYTTDSKYQWDVNKRGRGRNLVKKTIDGGGRGMS